MDPSDPLDELRALNPADVERLDDPELPQRAEQTLEQILRSRRRWGSVDWRGLPQRKRTYVLAVAVSSVTLGAAAALLIAVTGPTGQARAVQCYARADLRAGAVPAPVDGSAVRACRRVWQNGQLGRLAPARLQACKLPSGSPAVFPGVVDICRKLHLQKYAERTP